MTNFESCDGNPLPAVQRNAVTVLPNFHYMKYSVTVSVLCLVEVVERKRAKRNI